MTYIKWFIGLFVALFAFIAGRNSVTNAQNKEVLKHVIKAKEARDSIRSMSVDELNDELRKKPSDK